MAIFEYECASCGKGFEILVRHSSPAPECPGCSGSELRKKLSASGVHGRGIGARGACIVPRLR